LFELMIFTGFDGTLAIGAALQLFMQETALESKALNQARAASQQLSYSLGDGGGRRQSRDQDPRRELWKALGRLGK
jgi:hypothetical protein